MRTLPANSIDAIVCDPPYGIAFMGKKWDRAKSGRAFEEWCEQWAREAIRIAKPGAHILAFGGTRMFHRLASGLENAGWEIRDCLSWMYGSGFPKSLDVSKAIDKRAGATREVVGAKQSGLSGGRGTSTRFHDGRNADGLVDVTAPATDDAKQWIGWGTALKPAWEPIVLGRKPFACGVAENVIEHGTGALNINGCRIPSDDGYEEAWDKPMTRSAANHFVGGCTGDRTRTAPMDFSRYKPEGGRWPANVILDEEAAAMVDEQSGDSASPPPRGARCESRERRMEGFAMTGGAGGYADFGGASRFFYIAKASSAERDAGLQAMPMRDTHRYGAGIGEGDDPSAPAPGRNFHPTVKPVMLMRYLCRLITPPGGVVLDPFLGSGTTGVAAKQEMLDFVGVEREAEYHELATRRIDAAELGEPLFAQLVNAGSGDDASRGDVDDAPSLFGSEEAVA